MKGECKLKVVATLCDFCGEPLPIKKKKDFLGIERLIPQRGNLKHFYKGTEIDLRKFGYDCCELCASEIDLNAMDFKLKNLTTI